MNQCNGAEREQNVKSMTITWEQMKQISIVNRLWLCYIGESLIKKSKLRAESRAKVSIKFRPFWLDPVRIFGLALAALLRCECAAYLHVFVCLDARICGARLQYHACDRVGLWDRGWTARWMSERNRGWRSICQTQHWAEEQGEGER